MGRKRGMTQIFDESGKAVPCTLIEVEENVVAQIKTLDKDGYSSLQIGFEEITSQDPRTLIRRVSKPRMGHFRAANLPPHRFLQEVRVEDAQNVTIGQRVGVDQFKMGQYIDVRGVSKGKGYQGVMKLYNFRGIGSSHGAGPVHRHGGSRGQRSTPGRVFPGNKAAGRMGGRNVSIQSLLIVALDVENRLVCVRGAVPGSRNSLVTMQSAIKRSAPKK